MLKETLTLLTKYELNSKLLVIMGNEDKVINNKKVKKILVNKIDNKFLKLYVINGSHMILKRESSELVFQLTKRVA